MNEDLIKILEDQHEERMEMGRESIRLLELFTAEQRVSNVRTGMLDETLKKVLLSMTTLGNTSKDLLNEFAK